MILKSFDTVILAISCVDWASINVAYMCTRACYTWNRNSSPYNDTSLCSLSSSWTCRAITPLHQRRLFCWIAARTRPMPHPHPSIVNAEKTQVLIYVINWKMVLLEFTLKQSYNKKYHGKFNRLHVNAMCSWTLLIYLNILSPDGTFPKNLWMPSMYQMEWFF